MPRRREFGGNSFKRQTFRASDKRERSTASVPARAHAFDAVDLTRRGLLIGGGALGIAGLYYGGGPALEAISKLLSPGEIAALRRRLAALARSPNLEHSLRDKTREYTGLENVPAPEAPIRRPAHQAGSDLSVVLERTAASAINGTNCADFFHAEVRAGLRETDIPSAICEELSFLVPGLVAFESRYNDAAIGEEVSTHRRDGSIVKERAVSRIQVLPSTFTEYGFDMRQVHDAGTQARFLSKYFKEAWRIIGRMDLGAIQNRYFMGDTEGFRRYFLAPAIASSYQTGIGTMHDVIAWFASANLPLPQANGTYDVYEAMTASALANVATLPGDARNFGARSAAYFPGLFSFASLLDEDRLSRAGEH